MNKTMCFMMFIFGVAVGSAMTHYCAKRKYERIAQEEIDSVRDMFSKKSEDAEKATLAKEKPNITEYSSRLHNHGYTKASITPALYVVSPEEFGTIDEYEQNSLTYFADDILADENDERIYDVENVVGAYALNSFGEYEDDSVFVRNETLKCDYEILRDHRKYSDVVQEKPYRMEV